MEIMLGKNIKHLFRFIIAAKDLSILHKS